MIFQTAINKILLQPKQLFLLDGFGALLSAFSLGVVLVQLESLFGIPPNVLYILAVLPCFFGVYDFYCYFKIERKIGFFLKGIAFVNLGYCVLSLGFAYVHQESITTLGWTYIILEVLIVVYLAILEIKVANYLKVN